ncbi:MAG TPA: NUDIX hydrolase [Ktedonobacterales bacterium]
MGAGSTDTKRPLSNRSANGKRAMPNKQQSGMRAPMKGSGEKWRFRIGAFAIIERNGLVLLARRRDIGWWNLPGGGVEKGESVDEGLLREVREEVCADVSVVRLVGVYSKPQKDEVVLTFLCRLLPGQEDALDVSDEVSEVGWFSPTELPEHLLPKHRQRVLDALRDQPEAILRVQRTTTEEDQGLTRGM